MAERKIHKIKNDIIKHNQNPEDYQTRLETHIKTMREGMSWVINDGIFSIIHLIIFIIFSKIFITLLLYVDSHNLDNSIYGFLLIFPFSLFLLLFFFVLILFSIPNIIELFRCLFSKRKYDLDEYHDWYTTREKDIIDWWDEKTPIPGKIKYSKCSICGVKKNETIAPYYEKQIE
ncbi:MAG: hypothetical protein GQ533_03575 [Methanosarcinaceae archaeon]|nr:hypothetical protein [Methanosarcinaceae archaeon]